MSEKFENSETIEARLARLLKEKGAEDPEVRAELNEWARRELHSSQDPISGIELDLKKARLYLEAGYADEAWISFEAALERAWHEHRDELCERIISEMERLS